MGNYLLPQNYGSITSRTFLRCICDLSPRIINLHAIHGHKLYFPYGLLPELSSRAKLVWTLHDMWAFTGHCTYAYECQKWKTKCNRCPDLKCFVPLILDTTTVNFSLKKKVYQDSSFTVVCPSRWLCELAKQSPLFQDKHVLYIPYGIDTDVFFPRDKILARRWLGIPEGHKVILTVAHDLLDQRKGFRYFQEGLERARRHLGDTTVLLLGRGGSAHRIARDYPVHSFGYISHSWLLAMIYSAADLLVFPTLADNLPNVVLECMACGTPVVSFDIGGLSDMIEHGKTGCLAKYRDSDDLKECIVQMLRDDTMLADASTQSVRKIEAEFAYRLQADRYLELYNSL